VAAVQCFPVLHHCVDIFFWSSGIMDCMLLTFGKSSAHALLGVSGVASFITTDEQLQYNRGCFFSCRLCFLKAFSFIGLVVFISILYVCGIFKRQYYPILFVIPPSYMFLKTLRFWTLLGRCYPRFKLYHTEIGYVRLSP